MKKQDRQAALEALERNSEIFESSQKEQSICHAEFHTNQATIRSALTAQDVNKGIDNAREVFENWLTGNGNYPHLKYKSFGGIYLHEEAAIKWDGFKAGYYARAEAQKVVGE